MRLCILYLLASCVAVVLVVSPAVSQQAPPPQDHSMHSGDDMHQGMSMEMDDAAPPDPARQRKLLADKKESEFNHHLAGFFLLLAGIFLLAESALSRRWPFLRFVWPSCFLASGLFLLVFSDTELWPFGPQSWWYGLTHNPEDLQHKSFALILLALGTIEVQRARGALKSVWSGLVFPALACAGSVLLLFHEHHTGMHGAGHMTAMAQIQNEHQRFSTVGFGIGLFKGFSELPSHRKTLFVRLCSLLMLVLGALLIAYSE